MGHAVAEQHDVIGQNIGRFVVRGKLGRGGMGEVFLAYDSLLRRQVALKAIQPERAQGPKSHQRLLKEAERASQLNDEHIARIHDVVEHENRMYLVMEYVAGQTLRSRLTELLTTEEFFSIAEQCLAGLAVAHRCGIVHCDLKPENLMITPAGAVKILDFGFAQRVPTEETQDSPELSKLIAAGTPGYIAPEVLRGSTRDERADIFSMGVVLYEAFEGRHPFHASETGTTRRILQEAPHPMRRPAPAGLDLVIFRMLAKDPQDRYQSCTDALGDIRAVHSGGKPLLGSPRRKGVGQRVHKIASLAAVVVLAALIGPQWPGVRATPDPSNPQLVVLAFKPAAEDPSSRAFASGLTETPAAKLGQLGDRYPLVIIAASEAQKAKVTDAQQARTVLGATLTLEGSMQFSGNTVRVIYSLVDTRSLRQVHSGIITADASNPFAVQDRLFDEVLNSLDIELAKEDRGRMASHGTNQPRAYESYLRGRGYLQNYDRPENLDLAIAAFQHSLAADPKFAFAYAGLGQTYIQKYAAMRSPEFMNAAKNACSRAAELDGENPDGEICLGMLFSATGEYEKATQHLERAAQLDGRRDETYRALAMAYEKLQRLDEAEAFLKKAVAIRPQYWAGYKQMGRFYALHGRNDEAIEQFKRVVELAPDSFSGYSNLGAVYVQQGNYPAAIGVLEKSIAIRPSGAALSNLGAAYFYERRYREAAGAYEQAATMRSKEYAIFGNLAEAYEQVPGKQVESRKNYTRALELAQQWLEVNPRDSRVLLDAAVYAARLGHETKAQELRKSGLRLSARDPEARLRSAQVLAQLHKDGAALAELDLAFKSGLPAAEVTNDPLWQRFATNPRFLFMMRKQKGSDKGSNG
jgi:eukaryotic-like serine/threonine-protein kinase